MDIIEGARLPVLSWAAEIEDGALRQARNLGNLDVAVDHAALMPDAHSGFGMPIGGVLFTRTNLTWEDDFDRRKLRDVLRQIQQDVPTGFAIHKQAPLGRDRLIE